MSPAAWFRLLGLSCVLITAAFAVPALTQGERKGKRYALLVGVKVYDHRKLTDLKYTENDAEELATVLKKGGYDEVVVLTTTRGDKDAKAAPTKANIERELRRLLGKVTKRDLIVIGLAGHGVQYEVKQDGKKRDESFFCPSDAKLIDTDDFDALARTMLPFRELFKRLDDSGAGSRLLLVDACRNDPGSARNADTDSMPAVTRGTAALFACKGGERAFESDKLGAKGHGIFFYHVIQALRGAAKSDEGEVTWDDLARHVRRNVVKSVREHVKGGARQTPELMARLEGDPVLLGGLKDEAPAKDKDGGAKVVKEGKTFTNSVGMKFVRVKAGKFTMGSPRGEEDRSEDEEEHEVEVTRDFYLGVHEVTQGQFRQVMGFNPSYFSLDGKKADGGRYIVDPAGGKEGVKDFTRKELDEFPVENVSWEDAQAFLKKLNARAAEKEKGRVYRLPSEAEWEYACRGGPSSSTKPFHFKQPSDSLGAGQANFDARYPYGGGKKAAQSRRTNTAGKNGEPNALGLFDMHGNVWEWCQDFYDKDYYANSPKADPLCLKGSVQVYRGGGWSIKGQDCRSAFRGRFEPEIRSYNLGFRVALLPLK